VLQFKKFKGDKIMKKIFALLLTLILTLSLVACGNEATNNENSVNTDVSQTETSELSTSSEQSSVVDTESKTSNKTETASSAASNSSKTTSSTQSASSQPKPTTPTKLNPEKDFKYGKYTAKYFSDDKKTYTVCSLTFDKEYQSLQVEIAKYYNRAECERLYGEYFGFDADNLSEDFSTLTLNGVTYYTFYPAYTNVPEIFKLSATEIKMSPDGEKWAFLSLNANGTLVIDSATTDRYGKVGTTYTFVQE
jgi:hypothetical protein